MEGGFGDIRNGIKMGIDEKMNKRNVEINLMKNDGRID